MKRNYLVFLATAGLVMFTAAAAQAEQKTIRCESNDQHYHECTYSGPGKVKLSNTLSKESCELGRSWGVKSSGIIWVDRGCRADFVIKDRDSRDGDSRHPGRYENEPLQNASTTVLCESQDDHRKRCTADTRYGAQLSRQLSKDKCIEGRDWGYDRNGIWVDHGCRAEFTLNARTTVQRSEGTVLRCESMDNRRKRCSADTRYGVELVRQLSKDSCVEGRDWSYDANGVWVDHGCRAEFRVTASNR
ncbi:MAG TPA: DUF3011 domain-containing protein [Thermoanaerobaculia bacterium]|nr:DUF3011 domain-containing protein [Thermoanaerobaculia bacterium]